MDALIPALYLHGVWTGDMTAALSAVLGPQAAGLSPANSVRLKAGWTVDYQAWLARDLTGQRYVYGWADAIYFNVRLSPDRPCVPVLMGSLEDGTKELIAVVVGQRESKRSWQALLADLKGKPVSSLSVRPVVARGTVKKWTSPFVKAWNGNPIRCACCLCFSPAAKMSL